MFDCNKCKYLNLKESEQTSRKKLHVCLKYKKRVLHRDNTYDYHPKLVPCEECNQLIARLANLIR